MHLCNNMRLIDEVC